MWELAREDLSELFSSHFIEILTISFRNLHKIYLFGQRYNRLILQY